MAPRKRADSRRYGVRVEIQAPPSADNVAVQSATGEVSRVAGNWSTVATTWAAALPGAGGEDVIGGQPVGSQRWTLTLRRRTDLLLSYRLKVLNGRLAGKYLYVEQFGGEERAEEMTVICRQGIRG